MTSQNVSNANGCQDCPPIEQQPPEIPELVQPDVKTYPEPEIDLTWVFHTGGPPHAQLLVMVTTLPPDYARIQVYNNGDLEYKKTGPDDFEPPSPIDGYVCDQENQWLFHPLWKSCQNRLFSIVVKPQCQCVEVLAKCILTEGLVKYEACEKCKGRVEISEMKVPKKKTIQSLRLPDLDHNSK